MSIKAIKEAAVRDWAAKQEWDKGFQHVADQIGVKYHTVYMLAKRLGINGVKLMKRGRKLGKHDKIPESYVFDWDKRNCELARELNVTGETIRLIRLKEGRPRNQPTP